MRPGRAADLPALVELWRTEVRAGTRDSVPREAQLNGLLSLFDWAARSRFVDSRTGSLAGAVLVSSRSAPEGTVARVDPAATGHDSDGVMRELVNWGLQLSHAAGASATQVWVGPGHGRELGELGLEMVRPWWRMDRGLDGLLSEPMPVQGYRLVDGSSAPGPWADMHNRSFADHWRFSPRTEDELMTGKPPELTLMAVTASGEPAAITLSQLETYEEDARPQPVGIVSSVGTVPEHRRRGLATWLVAETLIRLRGAGSRHASLYVDGWNQTQAFEAYEKLGFELAFRAEVWEARHP
ncbi:MAG: GNAT family N-acetyltransferase [Candidatus Dormiibacterota bacterium]